MTEFVTACGEFNLQMVPKGLREATHTNSFINFSILPTMIDIVIAVVYFSTEFSLWFGLIVFITMVLYLTITISVTEWRTKFR